MSDLVTAAKSGDYLATLTALRDRLAEEITNTTSGRDLASLSKQLTDVLREINDMPDPTGESKADEIAQRREERRRAAQGNESAM